MKQQKTESDLVAALATVKNLEHDLSLTKHFVRSLDTLVVEMLDRIEALEEAADAEPAEGSSGSEEEDVLVPPYNPAPRYARSASAAGSSSKSEYESGAGASEEKPAGDAEGSSSEEESGAEEAVPQVSTHLGTLDLTSSSPAASDQEGDVTMGP